MHKAIRDESVPHCIREECNGLVKPEIVFFGEQLPAEFFENRGLPSQADLCIVMGTSLSVQPFASLPSFCRHETPRLLINQEQVGNLGSRADDVLLLEDCDSGIKKLAEACGWLEDLEALWAQTAHLGKAPRSETTEKSQKSRDELLQDEVDKLTQEVEKTLKLSQEQHDWAENHVDNRFARAPEEDTKDDVGGPASEQTSKTPSTGASDSTLSHVFPWLDRKSSL